MCASYISLECSIIPLISFLPDDADVPFLDDLAAAHDGRVPAGDLVVVVVGEPEVEGGDDDDEDGQDDASDDQLPNQVLVPKKK